MALARFIIDPSFGIDGATGTDTVPGLILRGDGKNLHCGKENSITPTTVDGLEEVPYLQQFYGKHPPTDQFWPRYTEEEDATFERAVVTCW